LFYQEKKAEI